MKTLYALLSLSVCYLSANAQQGFIENKGQWNSKVKFSINNGNSNFFLLGTGYKVSLNDANDTKNISDYFSGHHSNKSFEQNQKLILHSHSYEVRFINANPSPEIEYGDAMPSYNNYITGSDASQWRNSCRIYSTITYKNVYTGIDVRYYLSNHQFKYDLIINPGADATEVQLAFYGSDGLSKSGEDLVIKTSLGNMLELKPFSYQKTSTGKATVESFFSVKENHVRFRLSSYDKTKPLVIDPVLVFSSFAGSIADNWGFCSTYDDDGNFYIAGIVFGTGFPVNNGAYQTTFSGGIANGPYAGYDIAILKLDATGSSRKYATYLGGSGNEEPHNLLVNKNGELIITGITNSGNFPSTIATYGSGGNNDIFIAKLNAGGTELLAARKIGGLSDDGVNIRSKSIYGAISIDRNYGDDSRSEITTDNDGNIYFGSCTRSQDFPISDNVFQKTIAGDQDAIIIKLSDDLNVVKFSSYLGGNGDDAAFSIAISPMNGSLYVVGSTTSNNLSTTGNKTGPILYNTFQGGVCDGYIAEIKNDGSTVLNMSYVGTTGNDMLYELAIDNSGHPYIMGTTTIHFPVVNAVFAQTGGKQFITKLNASLNEVVYSTNFGTAHSAPDITPTAFGLDGCENVYVACWGGNIDPNEGYPNNGTTGLPVTSNAIRSTSDGADFYIFVLEKNAQSQLYGSFLGNTGDFPGTVGDHTDGGNSRFDKHGNLYLSICANCLLTGSFPTTPGAWATANPATTGAQCNMAAVKITMNLESCALPITLNDFSVNYKDHQSFLQWKTTQEINSSYFEIEHSNNAQQFAALGKVNASGNSSVAKSYSYVHNNPGAGMHYYRLKMFDKDGRFTNSEILSVSVSDDGKILYLYPNPAKAIVTVQFARLQKDCYINIINSKGAIVKKILLIAGSTQKDINVQTLPAGLYYLKLNDGNKENSISFVKQ